MLKRILRIISWEGIVGFIFLWAWIVFNVSMAIIIFPAFFAWWQTTDVIPHGFFWSFAPALVLLDTLGTAVWIAVKNMPDTFKKKDSQTNIPKNDT